MELGEARQLRLAIRPQVRFDDFDRSLPERSVIDQDAAEADRPLHEVITGMELG